MRAHTQVNSVVRYTSKISKILKAKKTYKLIYMDPPWEYGGSPKVGKAKKHYTTMADKAIAEMKIPSAKNCLIFAWTVSSKMADCIKIIEGWGFKFINVAFVWHKPNRTLQGYYTMQQTEFCLLFRKGKVPKKRGTRNERQFLSEKAIVHSKKPEEIRKRIKRMFPRSTKLEMFARQQTKGWDVFGNQVKNSIEL